MESRRVTNYAYLFLIPALVGLLVFRLGPIAAAFGISFTNWNVIGVPEWVGFGNYLTMLQSGEFWFILQNTTVYALMYVPGVTVVGMGLAVLLNTGIRAAPFFRGLYFLPYITSTVAVTLTWRWIFSTRFGLLNNFLKWLGFTDPPAWLADPNWALIALATVSVWREAGFFMLLFLAGLQGIDPTLREAARVDGATRWQVFRYVTLPLLAPTTFFVIIIALVRSSQTFEVTFALTEGGPNQASTTLAFFIYQNAFIHFDMGYASALAYLLCILVGLATLVNFRLRRRWSYA